jgi:hypothetical protein
MVCRVTRACGRTDFACSPDETSKQGGAIYQTRAWSEATHEGQGFAAQHEEKKNYYFWPTKNVISLIHGTHFTIARRARASLKRSERGSMASLAYSLSTPSCAHRGYRGGVARAGAAGRANTASRCARTLGELGTARGVAARRKGAGARGGSVRSLRIVVAASAASSSSSSASSSASSSPPSQGGGDGVVERAAHGGDIVDDSATSSLPTPSPPQTTTTTTMRASRRAVLALTPAGIGTALGLSAAATSAAAADAAVATTATAAAAAAAEAAAPVAQIASLPASNAAVGQGFANLHDPRVFNGLATADRARRGLDGLLPAAAALPDVEAGAGYPPLHSRCFAVIQTRFNFRNLMTAKPAWSVLVAPLAPHHPRRHVTNRAAPGSDSPTRRCCAPPPPWTPPPPPCRSTASSSACKTPTRRGCVHVGNP